MVYGTQSENKKSTVIYDGDCRFCIDQVNRIKKLDKTQVFGYLPRKLAQLDFPILESMDFEKGMCLIAPEGKCYRGADAIYQISKSLPVIRYFSWLYCLPVINQLAKVVYAWIAANRKKLGKYCSDGSCDTEA